MGSFGLAARDHLYAQDSTYHSLCYTSRGAMAGLRNSSMGPSRGIDPTTHRTMSRCSTMELQKQHRMPTNLPGTELIKVLPSYTVQPEYRHGGTADTPQ